MTMDAPQSYPTWKQAARTLEIAGISPDSYEKDGEPYVSLSPQQVRILKQEGLLDVLREADFFRDDVRGQPNRLELPVLQNMAKPPTLYHLADSPYDDVKEKILTSPDEVRLRDISHALDAIRIEHPGISAKLLQEKYERDGVRWLEETPALDKECIVLPDPNDKNAVIVVNPNMALIKAEDMDGGNMRVSLVCASDYISPGILREILPSTGKGR